MLKNISEEEQKLGFWQILNYRACRQSCERVTSPEDKIEVCADNGKTYSSKCYLVCSMRYLDVKPVYSGNCNSKDKTILPEEMKDIRFYRRATVDLRRN